MKQQQGKALVAVMVSFVVLIVFLIGVCAISWYSAMSYGNQAEKGVEYAHRDLQQVLGQYSIKVQEAANVPKRYQERLKDTMVSVMTARMGDDGMKAQWAWLQEAGIQYDASMEQKLQQIIEAGRNEFQNKQTLFLDKKRAYDTALGSPWRGMWLTVAGYPKINLDEFDVVTSAHSDEAFRTGQDKAVEF